MISVILPIYNGEKTIRTAVQSLLDQSSPEWELIIVDDGSIDKSGQIVRILDDSRIRYLYQDHQERSVARNRGIQEAKGDLLLFLDADDWLLPNAIDLYCSHASQFPSVQVFVGDGILCRDDQTTIIKFSEQNDTPVTPEKAFTSLILDRRIVGQNRTAVRRSLVQNGGIRFDPDLSYAEDWLFWLEILRIARPAFFSDVVSAYRWYSSSTTHQTDSSFRHNQLAQVRSKILTWHEFSSLPLEVRRHFFYQLLLEDLGGNQHRQDAVIHSQPLLDLPSKDRARLFGLIASDYLMRGARKHDVIPWLEKAQSINPDSLKIRSLSMLVRMNPRLAQSLLRVRRIRQNNSYHIQTKPS